MIDEQKLITDRAERIIKEWDRPIILQMDILCAVGMIGGLQLALRHPSAAQSPTLVRLQGFVTTLILSLDPQLGDLYRFLMMGFDANRDASLDANQAGTPSVEGLTIDRTMSTDERLNRCEVFARRFFLPAVTEWIGRDLTEAEKRIVIGHVSMVFMEPCPLEELNEHDNKFAGRMLALAKLTKRRN